MNGWMGKILRVNLTEGRIAVEDLDADLARKFIGGRGLASKMLSDEIDPKVDPISPENKLIFATGPLTGAGPIASCRYMVVTKGYLTGAIACSNSGGNFGPELKFAGYDIIIFEGKAKAPVCLLIEDDRVELRSARALWGKGVRETVASIREELQGQAGEDGLGGQGVPGCRHRAGRRKPGADLLRHHRRRKTRGQIRRGAVMGSKNLKAVAVKGSKSVTLHDQKLFKKILPGIFEKTRSSKTTGITFPTLGTPGRGELFQHGRDAAHPQFPGRGLRRRGQDQRTGDAGADRPAGLRLLQLPHPVRQGIRGEGGRARRLEGDGPGV